MKNGRNLASLVSLRQKPKSSVCKFWYRRNSMYFTWPKWLSSFLFLFMGRRSRWRMVGTRQVWIFLSPKVKSSLHKFWNRRGSMHFTCPKWPNSFSFLFTECYTRGRMVGTSQVWFYVGQKQRVLLCNLWHWRNSTLFTWPKWINSLLFIFKWYRARWQTVGTRQVWFCLGKKRRVYYATSDTEGARCILL